MNPTKPEASKTAETTFGDLIADSITPFVFSETVLTRQEFHKMVATPIDREINRLEKQRDDLLNALEELLNCDYTSGTHLVAAQHQAKSAIVKAKEADNGK